MNPIATSQHRRRSSSQQNIVPDTYVTFESDLGWIGFAFCDDVLTRLVFGHRSRKSLIAQFSKTSVSGTASGKMFELQERLIAFADGIADDFSDVVLDTSSYTTFQERVVKHCRRISLGKTMTYGQLAGKAGSPNAARAVGTVMSNNRFPLVVPCHRVVGANGCLGGFSAPDGLDMKRRLHQLEADMLADA